jgi:hypothetical protein
MLTRKSMRFLERAEMVGVECIAMNSGELLWKGTSNIVLRPLLPAILLPDDLLDKALLPVYPSELGVVRIDGMPERAPARASATTADGERMREIEKAWKREIEKAWKRKNVTAVLHVVL